MTTLEAFQQLVVSEAEELNTKIEKMESFGSTPMFEMLSKQERFRLSIQLGAMRLYLYILNERIHHFIHKGERTEETHV